MDGWTDLNFTYTNAAAQRKISVPRFLLWLKHVSRAARSLVRTGRIRRIPSQQHSNLLNCYVQFLLKKPRLSGSEPEPWPPVSITLNPFSKRSVKVRSSFFPQVLLKRFLAISPYSMPEARPDIWGYLIQRLRGLIPVKIHIEPFCPPFNLLLLMRQRTAPANHNG